MSSIGYMVIKMKQIITKKAKEDKWHQKNSRQGMTGWER